ncbi:MAG: TonB-dependent receptor plug domain-containing protein [Candidatus Kapaibacteriota bacterium]
MALALIALLWYVFIITPCVCRDTLEHKVQNEVTVEGIREDFIKVLSITKSQLELSNWALNNSAQAISIFPGIYVRDYGGIGGLKTISLRGFSSSDVGVFLDGIKINSPQNGIVDLSLIPLDAFEQVELTRGGASFIHGNNTSSGYLNFTLAKSNDKSSLLFSYGSFKQLKLNLKLPLNLFNFQKSLIIVNYYSSDGRYPIDVYEFGAKKTVYRDNNNINTISVFSINNFELLHLKASASIIYTNSVRGVPGAVVQNRIENKESKLYDELFVLNLKLLPTSLSHNFKILFGNILIKNKYLDPVMNTLLVGKPTVSYLNAETSLKFTYETPTQLLDICTYAEANFSSVHGDMLENPNKAKIDRNTLAMGVLARRNLIEKRFLLGIEASLRTDFVTNLSPKFSHYLGVFLKDTSLNLTTKLNFSENFRLPSFNEIYFMNYGTQDLLPERTSGFNLEFDFSPNSIFQASISMFYFTTVDKIIAVPKSPLQWSAKNISKTNSKGTEISLSTKNKFFNALFSMSILSTLDKTTNSPTYNKQLIYTPNILFNALISLPIPKDFSLTFRSNFVGRRYFLADNSKNSELKEYFLLDIVTSKIFNLKKFSIVFNFEICNAFDINYEIILNYPMPKRYFVFSIKSFFNNDETL